MTMRTPLEASTISLSLLIGLSAIPSGLAQASTSRPVAAQQTVKESVCKTHLPAMSGKAFRLLSVPSEKKPNETGVLLVVNCSDRQIVSLRDPSRSYRHVNEQVYYPDRRAHLKYDPHPYEFINFNERVFNTAWDHTAYSSAQAWTGPCRYDGLELTTVDPKNPADSQTVTFDIDICQNHLLALLTPRS